MVDLYTKTGYMNGKARYFPSDLFLTFEKQVKKIAEANSLTY